MENWFNQETKNVIKELNSNVEKGLTDEQVKSSREKYGFNELEAKKKKTLLVKFLEQFKDFMIIVLIIAAIVSGVVGVAEGEGITDTIIILVVVVVNAIIGVAQESKAEKSLEALQKLSAHASKVIRNGQMIVVPSRDLVPGDIVVLDTGDYVPADLRIIEAVNLKSQESALTGESVPVEKSSDVIEGEEVPLGDRVNMLFSSSLITYGRGKGIVVETGMNTEVGKIAQIINQSEEGTTPLQEKLNKLGKTLGIAALVICVIIFIVGILYGKEPIHMFMTAVSLAVAAIPEGLAAVSTIVLAIGVQRMVKRNAIVKKLPAVETLGSASVICSDKTGTLTQNKMTVQKIFTNNYMIEVNKEIKINNELEKLINIAMLCNDTKVGKDNELAGDPTETALIDMGMKMDVDVHKILSTTRIAELPFDSDRKLMSTVHEVDGKYVVYTKGAIDELLKRCDNYILNGEIKNDLADYKNTIDDTNEGLAKNALRVLGFAYKEVEKIPTNEEMKDIESHLTYVGMVGMIDPPREEAKQAVEKCKTAGIKTVMITGDHKNTACAIAEKLGILRTGNKAMTGAELDSMSDDALQNCIGDYTVFARVSPEHKVRIVKTLQACGEIVAMSGDGTNDAPALKTADIGCAMGLSGTDVAKNASDMILMDDNFATIVSAVKEGRGIYENIRKAIKFLLSCNIGEIITIFLAILFRMPSPLAAVQLLWVNLITDSLPAIALGMEPPEQDTMQRPPISPKEGLFTYSLIFSIITEGILIGALTLFAYVLGMNYLGNGGTMAFAVLSFSQLFHAYNMRSRHSLFQIGLFSNKVMNISFLLCTFLQFLVITQPWLQEIFQVSTLNGPQWMVVTSCSIAPVIFMELQKYVAKNTKED